MVWKIIMMVNDGLRRFLLNETNRIDDINATIALLLNLKNAQRRRWIFQEPSQGDMKNDFLP